MSFNIYCDESCHLPNDKMPIMVLGAVRCPNDKNKEIAKRLKEIKIKHGFHPNFEIKWNKVSQNKLNFYLDIIDYFFDDDDFSFRAVIANKNNLTHQNYNQTHDDWYYKMLFLLLKNMILPHDNSYIYLDKKDTQSRLKVQKLHEVLCNQYYDFDKNIIKRLQVVESHQVVYMQVADLLLGAICYHNRQLSTNLAKLTLIERIKEHSGYDLSRNTLPSENKFNILYWQGNFYG